MTQYDESQNNSTNTYACEVTGTRGIYNVEWPGLSMKCKVNNMFNKSDRSIHGYVKFHNNRKDKKGHLAGGYLNLTSISSRTTLVNRLKDAEPDVNWRHCVEQICEWIIDDWQVGTEVVVLDEESIGDLDEEAKYLVHPLIEAECINLFYGHGSHGKSLMAQLLACLLSAGIQEYEGLRMERPAPVLYLDYEETKRALFRRVIGIRKGLKLPPSSTINYRSMSRRLSEEQERLMDICMETNMSGGLLIIDSVSKACGGQQQEQEAIVAMTTTIRELQQAFNLTTLLIAHENKQGELFGSVFLWNESRAVFHVRKDQMQGEHELSIGLFHLKSNNGGILPKPEGFRATFTDDGATVITTQDVKESIELEKYMTVSDRIANSLSDGPKTAWDIAQELSDPDGRTYSENHIKKELSKRPWFVNTKDHKWALSAEEDEEWQPLL